jgi:cyanophycinase-like exopeptidase
MSGLILLAGGGEFQKGNEPADRFALEQAGGPVAPVIILPTAGGADGGVPLASRNGTNWFRQIGAGNVEALPVANGQDANNPALAQKLAVARLIYMAGGSPG